MFIDKFVIFLFINILIFLLIFAYQLHINTQNAVNAFLIAFDFEKSY